MSSPPLRPGQRFGNYTIVGRLGAGGMGTVYRASDATGREVALKLLSAGASEQAPLRLAREGRITASLDHRGIVRVYSAGVEDGLPYVVYALIEGATLEERLPSLTRSERLQIVLDVARALGYAHAHGVIHRDLKAENVLLDEANTALVADFGLAQAVDLESMTKTGALLGTPHTMAPEQATGRRHEFGPPTDVWALGALLYRCLTNETPFRGPTLPELLAQITSANVPPPRTLDPTIPAALEAVTLQALQRSPAQRFPDGNAFALALEGALEETSERPRRTRLMAGLLGLSLIGVASGAVLLNVPQPPAESDAALAADDPPAAPAPTAFESAAEDAARLVGSGSEDRLVAVLEALAAVGPGDPSQAPHLSEAVVRRALAIMQREPDRALRILQALASTGLQLQAPRVGSDLMAVAHLMLNLKTLSAGAYWRFALAAAQLDLPLCGAYVRILNEFPAARPWSASTSDPWKRYLHLRMRLEGRETAKGWHEGLLEILNSSPPRPRLGRFHWSDSAIEIADSPQHSKIAQELGRRAAERAPDNPYVFKRLAGLSEQAGDYAQAVAHARRSLELFTHRTDPSHEYWNYRTIHVRLIELQAATGDRDGARVTWKSLRTFVPGVADALLDDHPWLREGGK